MTKEERAAWQNGYLIACCNLANMHDRPELASDVLAEGGITKSEAEQMDLSEYDKRALNKIRKARNKDPLCNGYREVVFAQAIREAALSQIQIEEAQRADTDGTASPDASLTHKP